MVVPYTGALRLVYEHVKKHHSVELVDGSTSRTQRGRIFGAFQDHTDPESIVANPEVLAHGMNLTAADLFVWMSPIHSIDIYDQANERIDRPGQTRNTTIARISGCPLEQGVYKVLANKGRAQDEFLELFKQELLQV
jgi:SNF2 family DNA or RNA helicase